MSRTLRSNGNIYMKARLKAANFNDKLKSREGASEILGVSPSSLLNYEKDVCKQVPTDVIVKMAEIYNAPELMNYYCCNECLIGKYIAPHLEIMDIQGLTLNIVSCLKSAIPIGNNLIEISKDGIISEDETPKMQETINNLDEICKYAQSLKVLYQKGLKQREG